MIKMVEKLTGRKFTIPDIKFKRNWRTEPYIPSPNVKFTGAMSGVIQPDLLGEKLLGETTRGNVFLYLFRRFGYSGFPTDDHKSVVRYILTTPMKGVMLIVNPGVETWSHFGYLITEEYNKKLEDIKSKPYSTWTKRMKKWAKETHSEEFTLAIENYGCNDTPTKKLAEKLWKQWMVKKYPNLLKKDEKELTEEQIDSFWDNQTKLWKKYTKLYEKVEPSPDGTHFENHPLKKRIDKALLETMYDLKKVVYIRDVPYNIYGQLSDDEASKLPQVEKSHMAGYGVFIEAYKDYESFIKFVWWVKKQGRGDLFKGIKKLHKGKKNGR